MAICKALVFNDRIDLSEEEKMAMLFCQEASSFFKEVQGKIYAVPSLRKGREMDLVVWMNFERFKPTLKTGYISNPREENEKIYSFKANREIWFNNVLLVLELKKHNTQDSISIRNGNLYVKYVDGFKNASEQNSAQVFHLKSHLAERLNINSSNIPKIHNFIWLNRCSGKPEEYDEIDNIIYGPIKFESLLSQLVQIQKPISYDEGLNISFSSTNNQDVSNLLNNYFEILSKEKAIGLGRITRNKFEKIFNLNLSDKNKSKINEIGEKLLVIKGKPGTGKTIYLLNIAYLLIEKEFRPIILTYNKALVLDINRMLYYNGRNDLINVITIHKFLLDILNKCGYKNLIENNFEEYEKALHLLFELVSEDSSENIKKQLGVNLDVVLIDEAQDCLTIEKELLFKIFGKENIIISNGDRQIVRNNNNTNWTESISRNNFNLIILEVSYRNKKDLVDFFNTFSTIYYEENPWNLKENNSITGGKLYLIQSKHFDKNFHKKLVDELSENGNSMYDMMFLTPNYSNANNYIKILEDLIDSNGYKSISNLNDCDYKFPVDEHRVLNFHSCRGLEAWILVCWNLDLIIKNIKDDYTLNNINDQSLKLYITNWLLIIFSRAIDTLVITFDDINSEEAKLILRLASSDNFIHMSDVKVMN